MSLKIDAEQPPEPCPVCGQLRGVAFRVAEAELPPLWDEDDPLNDPELLETILEMAEEDTL